MTPIDNAVLSEMLDNALSDIKYLRQEVSALRETKAEAKAEAYELSEELAEVRAAARDHLRDNASLRCMVDQLTDEAVEDARTWEKHTEYIAELENALDLAIARADENANKLTASVEQAQAWAYKFNRSEREVDDLKDQLALYQENCECAQ